MESRLSGFSTLNASLAGLPLNLGWAEDAIRRLRFYVNVKLSLFTFCAVLTPLPYVNNRVAELVYGELRFPAISN
jgi:hypothetical protein